jgi:hypothetical protein
MNTQRASQRRRVLFAARLMPEKTRSRLMLLAGRCGIGHGGLLLKSLTLCRAVLSWNEDS